MDNDKIIVVDEQGQEIEMEILFNFESDETKKNYVLYFNPKDEQSPVYVAIYHEDGTLEQVTDPNEWEMIEEVFNTFVAENEMGGCDCCECEEDDCGCGCDCGCHH